MFVELTLSRYIPSRLLTKTLLNDIAQELPDAVEPGVAACAGGRCALEAVGPQGKGVELALDAHAAHPFPCLHGAHGGIAVGIAMNEEHGSGLEVETEFRHQHVLVLIAATVGDYKVEQLNNLIIRLIDFYTE